MRLVEQAAVVVSMDNPLHTIEVCGRLCYKSKSDYSDETAENFVKKLVNNKHYAMLEHSNFVFEVDKETYKQCKKCKYLRATDYNDRYLVSGNMRAINESGVRSLIRALYDLKRLYVYAIDISDEPVSDFRCIDDLSELSKEEYRIHKVLCMQLTTNRAIANELIRHRDMSYAQVSTRYVNYKEGIPIIRPSIIGTQSDTVYQAYMAACAKSEGCYKVLLNNGVKPEIARDVLPLGLATDIVVTGNLSNWQHIFRQRLNGETGRPHPAMQELMQHIKQKYDYAISEFDKYVK